MGSIRWKILLAFLFIIGVAFAVTVSSLTELVSNYLYTQRTRQDSLAVEKLSTTLAPLFQSASSDALTEEIASAAGEMGGRLLLVDEDGKVQYDSFGKMYGTRLALPEVTAILVGGDNTAYGIHALNVGNALQIGSGSTDTHVSYCAARLVGTRGSLGALVFVSPVEEMMGSLAAVEKRMTTVFVLVAAAALLFALVLSRVITNPITAITDTMKKMGKGDLSVRVPVQGTGELREMAMSYNAMAEQLESLDKSRNQFVSNASHELKTPLATMKILLESLIYQPEMPEELRTEFMQDMDHEIDRLTSIVTDLLTLSQMDNHRLKLNLKPVDLSALAGETIRLLTPMAEKRGQTLRGEVAAGIITKADASKLGQVFYNLTENAVKYTPDGGCITLTLRRDGKQAVFSVRDNGVGIPKEDQAHIFERFYRVDKARSRETGGTGLGLSIVKQMVALHGGEVTVESEMGQGSVFSVTLPIRDEEAHTT